ncbi:hypothetical protein BC628DRAFT_262703 [Trametes gibbosa]|nr:hypothetical protein BC628DRAFT_262703 [Trametes gibbosa]
MAPAQSSLFRLSEEKSDLDPKWWTAGTGPNRNQWRCAVCINSSYMGIYGARRHNISPKHRDAVAYELVRISRIASSSSAPPPAVGVGRDTVVGPLYELLQDISFEALDVTGGSQHRHACGEEPMDIDWDTVTAEMGGGNFDAPTARTAIANMTASLAKWMLGGDSDDSDPEQEENYDDIGANSVDAPNGDLVQDTEDPLASGIPRERMNLRKIEETEWFPWPDKPTCVLDVLRHLPRSLFSDSQMEVILWSMDMLGIDHRPSLAVLKSVDQMLQAYCGIDSIRYEGPLGHVYYTNDLAAILAQEMSNPRVRTHLRLYPEECVDSPIKEGWQAHRWRKELKPGVSTPMVRTAGQDFYAYEPAKLADGRVISPFRWFTRLSQHSGRQEIFGEGWVMHTVSSNTGARGYVVHGFECVTFPVSHLVQAFPRMSEQFSNDNLPDPRCIIGAICQRD